VDEQTHDRIKGGPTLARRQPRRRAITELDVLALDQVNRAV